MTYANAYSNHNKERYCLTVEIDIKNGKGIFSLQNTP